MHDRDAAEHAATVRAAGAATALLLENQRLEAELRAHIVELRASRARLVEAGDTERRRLERNLHDGAQSRLVALALNLRLARGGFEDGSPAAALVEASIDEVRAEPRRAARARPRDPSRRAVRARPRARAALARRSHAVSVEFVGGPAGRLPAAVETAAYFVVSEALDERREVRARRACDRPARAQRRPAAARGIDDGVGGAALDAGSGLRGLSDRVAALDGALDLSSPPGAGTRLRVRLPCG